MKFKAISISLFGLAIASCAGQTPPQVAGGNPLDDMSAPRVVASGFISTEGPVWHAHTGRLIFTDIPGNTIYSYTPASGETSVMRSPSDASNGLTLDNEGYLLAAEQSTRAITRMNLDTLEVTPFISDMEYDGASARFNSPNDMVVHPNGNVYFTDPPFGIRRDPQARELPFNGFFVRRADGGYDILKELPENINPNGVIFNPEFSVLYLNISDDESGPIYAYDVDADGNLSSERVFALAQNADGLAMDMTGNLYVATRTGIDVFSKAGDNLGKITLPGEIRTTNVAFGGADLDTLYITGRSADLYAVSLPGVRGVAR